MLQCPDCGLPLQTLDLPCPACDAAEELPPGDEIAVHRFAKSFKAAWAFRPDPDGFVATINQWLDAEPGLRWVEPRLHPAATGIGGATLLCTASLEDLPYVLRLDRVSLVKGTLAPRPVRDLGSAIDEWRERHPDAHVMGDEVLLSPAGDPTELWVLAAYERDVAPPLVVPEPRGGFMGVQRLIAPLLLPWFVLFFVGASTAEPLAPLKERAILGAVTAVLAWTSVRHPVWTRRRTVPEAATAG